MSDNQALTQRVRELEARLEASGRVLFRLISWQRNFNDALLGHLFGKKISRKALVDAANDVESHQRGKEDYYAGFAAAIDAEVAKNNSSAQTGDAFSRKTDNLVISIVGRYNNKEFSCLMSKILPDMGLTGSNQCFPLYYYEGGEMDDPELDELAADADGLPLYCYEEAETDDPELDELTADADGVENYSSAAPNAKRLRRKDAITDETLTAFRQVYPRAFADYQGKLDKLKQQHKSLAQLSDCGPYSRPKDAGEELTKEDVFFYVYGLLHSPEYRERFAVNLNKELPRIPFAKDFLAFAQTGRKLAQLHLEYETGPLYPLEERYNSDEPSLRRNPGKLTKMRWGKGDKSVLVYNDNLTLCGIPERAHDYVVNGRSALEWLICMYQVKTDKASGIVSDPNLYSEDPRYVVDLIKRVTYVSLETVKLVEALPALEEQTPAEGILPPAWRMLIMEDGSDEQ